jgi:hypothetical protein
LEVHEEAINTYLKRRRRSKNFEMPTSQPTGWHHQEQGTGGWLSTPRIGPNQSREAELGTASVNSAIGPPFADVHTEAQWRRDVASDCSALADTTNSRTSAEVSVGHLSPARQRLKFTRERIKPVTVPAAESTPAPDAADADKTPFVPDDQSEKLLADFTAEVRKRQVSASENFDKSVLTLSTSGLAVSLAFLKDFIPIGQATGPWMLYASWGLLTAATVITMSSFLASMRAQEFQQAIAVGHYRRGEPHDKPNPWDRAVIWLNRASGVSFITGISLTTLFVAINLQRAHEVKNLQQASNTVPEHRGLPSPGIVPSAPVRPASPPPSAPAPQSK